MVENLIIREATYDDIDFVIETIMESEKSSSNIVSSCRLFALSETQFRDILSEVLKQNVPNYDYYLSGFLIAELNGKYVGALGSWYEAAEDTPSGIIKATVLFPYLDKTKMKDISKNTKVIKGLTINRKPHTLQLEHGYTRKEFRRQGIFSSLIKTNIIKNREKYNNFDIVQGVLFKENYKSFNAHLKIGYKVIEEKHVEDSEVLKFFPFDTKVLMELDKEIFSTFK